MTVAVPSVVQMAGLPGGGAVWRRVAAGEAAADHSIGLAWRDRGRPQYAERYLRRAISLYQDLGRRTEEAAVARDLAAARSA